MLIEEALRRQRLFDDLDEQLHRIKRVARKLDPCCEVFLFGSVAEGRHTYSSDIDVLVVTHAAPERMHLALWRAGVKEPFEVHVQHRGRLDLYRRRGRLSKIE